MRLHEPREAILCDGGWETPSYPVLESDSVMARKNGPSRASYCIWSILYLVHWVRWLHVGSIIPVKRELTAIALGSRPRRFLTAKLFSWTTTGVDSDILDSEIRCRNVRDDFIFRRNVIWPFREKMCERCLDFKYSQTRSHIILTRMWLALTYYYITYTIIDIIFIKLRQLNWIQMSRCAKIYVNNPSN